jgi:hypothetical protein
MPDDAVETTAESLPEETPRPHNPAPDDEPIPDEEDDDEEGEKPLPFDAEPVAVREVQPKLGLREYVALSGISQVQSSMLQVWMQQHGNVDTWGHYDKAEWDAYLAQAKAYTPRV